MIEPLRYIEDGFAELFPATSALPSSSHTLACPHSQEPSLVDILVFLGFDRCGNGNI